jgi:hypothetical protein
MEEVGILYCHLVYFMDIWYNLWTYGIIYGHLIYLLVNWYICFRFGKNYRGKKSGNPGAVTEPHPAHKLTGSNPAENLFTKVA